MDSNQYYVVFRWMRDELHLSKHEVNIYAIIYGFSQNGENTYNSSLSYLADLAGVSKSTTIRTLKKLVDEELVQKIDKTINGVKFCQYRVINVIEKREEGKRENNRKRIEQEKLKVTNREMCSILYKKK